MTLRLHSGGFLHFLNEQARKTPREPAPNPRGLIVISGQIVRENLQHHLNRDNLPTARVAEITTIEDLSRTLLTARSESDEILDSALRDRITQRILRAADIEYTALSLSDLPVKILPAKSDREALIELATLLPYEEEDVRESLIEELDDYYRSTDAGNEHNRLLRTLHESSNAFAQVQGERAIHAFQALDSFVEGQIAELPLERHTSRSHLVNGAREAVRSDWSTHYDHLEWIAVTSISVFDNPTLRLLAEIASTHASPDLDLFVNRGSLEYNARRIDALPVDTVVPDGAIPDDPSSVEPVTLDSAAASHLLQATQDTVEDIPANVALVEAPNNRRLVERIANDVRERLQDGAVPSEFLIVAPNAGDYKTLAKDAFTTVGIPLHIQTRRPMADVPAYRYLRSFVHLIEQSEQGEPLTHGELMDPLRLGYCPRQSHPKRWPLSGQEFTQIEQRLHLEQQKHNSGPDRYPDQGITLETWRGIIDDIPSFTAAWWGVKKLLDDVESWHDDPPQSREELNERLGKYLGAYVHHTVDHERQLYEGPAVDTTRVAISETHATSLGERVRNQLDAVGRHYGRTMDLFDEGPSWEGVGRALSVVLGSDTYGKSQLDRNTIPLVDAGNSYFRQAKYLYILGMNAEEFPPEPAAPTFLHESLREEVYNRAVSGESPYLHLDNRASEYGEAVDFYQAALSAAKPDAEISLFHTYRDNRGNEVAWSSFVDMFNVEDSAERTAVGEWLPQPAMVQQNGGRKLTESWESVGTRIAPRERLRTVLYNAHRSRPESRPEITDADVADLLGQIDVEVLITEIAPRIDRYHRPPTTITIDDGEPAFEETPYTSISAEPYHPHEFDLLAQCGLKYYYYQFLYNFEGRDPDRKTIPYYSSNFPHHRLGKLPYIVRENYADPRYVEKWQALIENHLPERQSTTNGLRQFTSDDELYNWLFDQEEFDSYDENTIYQNLRAERYLVEAEVNAGIERGWEWRSGGDITIEGHSMTVPPYRADRVETDGGPYHLPIFYTRFSNRARSAVKGCFEHEDPIWEIEESCRTLCVECSDDDCTYHSKYVLDHRLVSGREYERSVIGNKVLGIGLQEQFGDLDGARFVVVKTHHINDLYRGDGLASDVESIQGRGMYSQWYENKVAAWEADVSDHATKLDPSQPIELSANEALVTQDECLRCVYRDLCMVPERGVFE